MSLIGNIGLYFREKCQNVKIGQFYNFFSLNRRGSGVEGVKMC